jgi:hypothetical protein
VGPDEGNPELADHIVGDLLHDFLRGYSSVN